MIELDGKTVSDNKFSGPIGKLINSALDFPISANIPEIDVEINLPDMEVEILNDLSSDQKYLYDIVSAIKNRDMSVSLKCKIGPHNHARWLNLANRLCRLFFRNSTRQTKFI